jgi:RNA polymerase sigma factor (sigma-70 family)
MNAKLPLDTWSQRIRAHDGQVRRALMVRGVPEPEAAEIVQDAWIRLLQRERQGRLERVELPGLAIAQALSLWRDRCRRPGLLSLEGEPATPLVSLEDRDLIRRSLSALEELPERPQRIFEAALGPGPASAIAAREGLSTQRVRQIVCEVRAHLRLALAIGALLALALGACWWLRPQTAPVGGPGSGGPEGPGLTIEQDGLP